MAFKMNLNSFFLTALSGATLFLSSCGGGDTAGTDNGGAKPTYSNKVVQHSLSDPDQLNPYNAQGEQITYMASHVFQSLILLDFKTYEYVPVLAASRPVLTATEDGGMTIDYEIRPEAVWDNGTPITGKDVEFSLKVMKNPKTDCLQKKPYFEYINDIEVDAENPKKFRLICKEPYHLAEGATGDLWILPAYVYDPQGLMSKFSVKELATNADNLKDDPTIIEYANFFNSEKFQKEVMIGSGPYTFDRWETDARVVLKKKENWWGDQLADVNQYYEAFPDEIVYETIKDLTTAVTALKSEKLDVMRSIQHRDFVKDLQTNQEFLSKFNTFTPAQFAYDYIGFNMRNPKFNDVNVRKAFAHLIDVDKIVETLCYGLGTRTVGIIHPDKKIYYNSDLKPYDYNIEKAKELLANAGWKDTNGDGILDKEIDGVHTEFVVDIFFNNGNDRRKKTCLFLKEGAKKVGIEVNVLAQDWAIFLERTKKHDFELYVGGWIAGPSESDPKQIWHTESYSGGSNYVGFGNAESDALIMKLRRTLDQNERAQVYKDFQKLLHEQVPYIFLMAQKERIAIHKKWDNAYGSGVRPGYWEAGFKLAQ